jgi:hypothetical protein
MALEFAAFDQEEMPVEKPTVDLVRFRRAYGAMRPR